MFIVGVGIAAIKEGEQVWAYGFAFHHPAMKPRLTYLATLSPDFFALWLT